LLLSGFLGKLKSESLFKNTAFLFGNLILTTGCGFGALTLLTHIFSVQVVGLSGTAMSGCVLVENITQLGVTYSLPRFLPTTKNRHALINTVLTTILLSTVLVAAVFLALPYTKSFLALGGWVFAFLFVLVPCVLAAELVLGTVLVADRAAGKVASANVVPNLLGLAAPAALMFLGGLGAFIARAVSDVASCIFYTVIIARRGHRFRAQLDFTDMREVIRFSGGMHVANFIGGLPLLMLPLIVFSRVGAKEAAFWGIAMSIATFLFQLPSLTIRALLPEASHRPAERRQLFRRSALLVSAVVIPALTLAFLLSPIALAIFGGRYVAGALGPLRWLIVAALVSLPLSVLGAILVMAKKSLMTTIANAVDAIVVLGLVELWAKNVDQIAISWTIGELGNIVLFSIFAFMALREVDWRWENLGGAQAESAIGSVPLSLRVTGQLQALTVTGQLQALTVTRQLQGLATLAEIAEQQRGGGAYEMGRRRPTSVRDGMSSIKGAPTRSAETDVSHQRAFNLLFDIAKRQRTTGWRDRRDPYDADENYENYRYDDDLAERCVVGDAHLGALVVDLAEELGRDANRRPAGRHVANYHGSRANPRAVPHGKIAEDARAGADVDAIADHGDARAALPDRHAVVDGGAGANPRAVPHSKIAEDARAGADVDAIADHGDARAALPDRHAVVDGGAGANPRGRMQDHAASAMAKGQAGPALYRRRNLGTDEQVHVPQAPSAPRHAQQGMAAPVRVLSESEREDRQLGQGFLVTGQIRPEDGLELPQLHVDNDASSRACVLTEPGENVASTVIHGGTALSDRTRPSRWRSTAPRHGRKPVYPRQPA
jgi:O-antigen/teichoic acid export membrane protein